MGDVEATAAGQDFRGYRRGTVAGDPVDQYVVPVEDKLISFSGRAATFKTIGNGTSTTQNLLALHNASGSSVIVRVNRITVDMLTTVVKAVTVVPPVIRVRRFTALPSAGSTLSKTGLDSTQTSSSSVTAWGTTASDGGSLTTLAVTGLGMLAQKYAPRCFTAVGYEPVDTAPFFHGEPDITLRALEGVVVALEGAVTSTGNPATDFWTAEIDWDEYTRP